MFALYLHFRKQTQFVLAGLEEKLARARAEEREIASSPVSLRA